MTLRSNGWIAKSKPSTQSFANDIDCNFANDELLLSAGNYALTNSMMRLEYTRFTASPDAVRLKDQIAIKCTRGFSKKMIEEIFELVQQSKSNSFRLVQNCAFVCKLLCAPTDGDTNRHSPSSFKTQLRMKTLDTYRALFINCETTGSDKPQDVFEEMKYVLDKIKACNVASFLGFLVREQVFSFNDDIKKFCYDLLYDGNDLDSEEDFKRIDVMTNALVRSLGVGFDSLNYVRFVLEYLSKYPELKANLRLLLELEASSNSPRSLSRTPSSSEATSRNNSPRILVGGGGGGGGGGVGASDLSLTGSSGSSSRNTSPRQTNDDN